MLSLHIKVFTLSFKKILRQYLQYQAVTRTRSSPPHLPAGLLLEPSPAAPPPQAVPPLTDSTLKQVLHLICQRVKRIQKAEWQRENNFNIAVNSTIFSLLLTNPTADSREQGFAQSLRVAHWKDQEEACSLLFSCNHGLNIFLEVLPLKTLKGFYYEIFSE